MADDSQNDTRNKILEYASQICETLKDNFSRSYPKGYLNERWACGYCAKAIRAAKITGPAAIAVTPLSALLEARAFILSNPTIFESVYRMLDSNSSHYTSEQKRMDTMLSNIDSAISSLRKTPSDD